LMVMVVALTMLGCTNLVGAQEMPATSHQGEGGETDPSSGNKPKPKPTELDLPEDSTIKIRVFPLMPSNLVDRVGEPATVTVDCPGALSAEVFIVPVDAPYGGHALDRPRLIGKDIRPHDGLTVAWSEQEPDQYVKLFAVVRKRSQPDHRLRSHTIDLAMYGSRYKPAARTGTGTGGTGGTTPESQR
jgi:hypothetical protein